MSSVTSELSNLIENVQIARQNFFNAPEKGRNKYLSEINEYLKLVLPKDGLVCIVSKECYKPTGSFDRIVYVDLEWFDGLIPELKKQGLRLVETTITEVCACTSYNCECNYLKIKSGYNIYIC
jgi:hypothetical protein